MEHLEQRMLLSGNTDVFSGAAAFEPRATQAAVKAAALPSVSVVATSRYASETNTRRGIFTFTRTGGTTKALTVYFTMSNSAKNGVDYKPVGSSVVIPAGSATTTLSIYPIDDTIIEKTEYASLTLKASTTYALGATKADTVWIANNDGNVVTVTAPDAIAAEGPGKTALFQFKRTGDISKALTVTYSVRGTATNGLDYTRLTGLVTFAAKASTANVALNPIDDLKVESAESVQVQIVDGYYVIGSTSYLSTASIADNDADNATTGLVMFRDAAVTTVSGHVFAVQAKANAVPTDLSAALNQIAAGNDLGISISPDAAWLVLRTTRWGGSAQGSLAVMPADNLAGGQQVKIGGQVIVPVDGNAVIADGGNVIIFAAGGGTHQVDLWAAKRDNAGVWTKVEITTGSTYAYNTQPSFSHDGTKILFVGSAAQGGGDAIDEVGVDGTGLSEVVTKAGGPGGSPAEAILARPDYFSDGDMVFQSDWTGVARVYRMTNGLTPVLLGEGGTEKSPIAFADGRIVTLWDGRVGNDDHVLEMTLRYNDGTRQGTVMPSVGLPDVGLSTGI